MPFFMGLVMIDGSVNQKARVFDVVERYAGIKE